MKHILIVEDELLIATVLKKYIVEAGYKNVYLAINYEEALNFLAHKKIDFIFLDITLKEQKTGLDIASYVNSNYSIPFMFLTSHSDTETLQKISNTTPVGYLSKPFKAIDVTTALKLHLGADKKNNSQKFKLKINTSIYYIDIDDIYYAVASHVYSELQLKSEHLILRVPLSELITLLPKGYLVRINRSTAINPKHITRIDKNSMSIGNKQFKLSSSYFENYGHLIA